MLKPIQENSDFRSTVTKGNSGLWTASPPSNYIPYPHEFAHLLGLDDGYFDVFYSTDAIFDADKIQGQTKENYNKNDVVVDPNGIVTQDDVDALGDYIMKQYTNQPTSNNKTWT
ncbi:MAG: hypothetical protein ABI199_00205 [Bacteroidia bacterium]